MIPEDGGKSLDSRDAHSSLEPAEPAHKVLVLIACGSSDCSDETVYPRIIDRDFTTRTRKVVTWLRPTFWTYLNPLDRCARMNV